MSLNSVLGTAGRSLEVCTAGIQVAGHNIANASTPGYIRENLILETNVPYKSGQNILGTGVSIGGIIQQVNLFLETRVLRANTEVSASQARESIFKQLEAELAELGESDLSSSMSDFLAAMQDLANQPELASSRELMIGRGEKIAGDIASLRFRVDDLRREQSVKIDGLVKEANMLIQKISDLNPQITRLEASGLLRSDAGALRSQRYAAMQRLSEIIPTRFVEREDGAVDLFSGSDFLILTGQVQQLETFAQGDRGVRTDGVQLSLTNSHLTELSGGELGGLLAGRDTILGGFVDELDQFTSNLIYEFNRLHSTGEGLSGYTSLTATNGVSDSNDVLTQSDLAFKPEHGSFELKIRNKLSGQVETTIINVDLDGIGADTTLESLRAAIDAAANVGATIDSKGRLQLTAATDYEIRFGNDTSGVLASLGINTFFTGSDSVNIGVNATVKNDHRLLATSQGGGPSDNRNALLLSQILDRPVDGLTGNTLDEYYSRMVASLAQRSAAESSIAEGLGTLKTSLMNQRNQYSGVSLDEEAIKVLEFQHAFSAAARLVSTVDELFGILLSM